jgi:hypothetical protein
MVMECLVRVGFGGIMPCEATSPDVSCGMGFTEKILQAEFEPP